MLELVVVLFTGCILGCITGLTPGLHLNTIALLALSFSPFLVKHIGIEGILVGIVAMSITHTFVDAIPSIYLGAPDEAQVLSVLPGHRMLLKGEGHNAVKLTVIGSFLGLTLAILLVPLLILIIKKTEPLIRDYIGYILIVVMLYMIFKDKNFLWNLALFMLSGTLGLIVLSMPNTPNVLFPLLSGLFGFSVLLVSLKSHNKIPQQYTNKKLKLNSYTLAESTLAATVVGFIASFLPGFGSSQAAVLASQFIRKIDDAGFLLLVGGINTVNMGLSLVTLYVLHKARNGSVLVLGKIIGNLSPRLFLLALITAFIAALLAVLFSLFLSKVFSGLITRVNYRGLVMFIMAFITLLVVIMSGYIGIIILITSTALGLVAGLKGVAKSHLMGCLILPVILYFVL